MLLHGTKKDQGRLKAARSLLAVNPATSAYNDRVDTVLPLPVETAASLRVPEKHGRGNSLFGSREAKFGLGSSIESRMSPVW